MLSVTGLTTTIPLPTTGVRNLDWKERYEITTTSCLATTRTANRGWFYSIAGTYIAPANGLLAHSSCSSPARSKDIDLLVEGFPKLSTKVSSDAWSGRYSTIGTVRSVLSYHFPVACKQRIILARKLPSRWQTADEV